MTTFVTVVESRVADEKKRLLAVQRAGIHELVYGKWWVFSFSNPVECIVLGAIITLLGVAIFAGVMTIYTICKGRGG